MNTKSISLQYYGCQQGMIALTPSRDRTVVRVSWEEFSPAYGRKCFAYVVATQSLKDMCQSIQYKASGLRTKIATMERCVLGGIGSADDDVYYEASQTQPGAGVPPLYNLWLIFPHENGARDANSMRFPDREVRRLIEFVDQISLLDSFELDQPVFGLTPYGDTST